MKTFAKCVAVLRLVFIERLTYRVNFFLQILSGILSSLIIVFLWLAVYWNAGQEAIGGYTTAEMVTYLLGGGLINTFVLTTAENPETSQSIQDGTLSALLTQPLSPYGYWFFRDLGSKMFLFLLGMLGYAFIFWGFRNYLVLCPDGGHLLLFLLSLGLAALLQFFLFESLSLLAFWIENTYGIRFATRVILETIGGAIIPLSFFPPLLEKIFLALPFHYLIYLPMKIYLGKIPLEEAWLGLLKEILWMVGLALLSLILWRRGLRHYVAMGD